MAEQELSTKKPQSIREVVVYIDDLIAEQAKNTHDSVGEMEGYVKHKVLEIVHENKPTGVQTYIDNQDGVMTDKERIERLELLVSRLAVMTGQGNLLPEYGIERWLPGKKDMNKYE